MEVEKTEVQSIPQKRREYADIRKLAEKGRRAGTWEEHCRVAKDEKAGVISGLVNRGPIPPHFVLPSS